jgi:hypothetical protein
LDAKVPGGPVIPTQVFDFEIREWVRYDESQHPVPESEADPDGVNSVELDDEEVEEDEVVEDEVEEVDVSVEEAPPRPRAQPVLFEAPVPVNLDEDLDDEAPEEVVEDEEDGDD